MYCSNCGKEVNENDNFCRYCGISLTYPTEIIEQKNIEKDNTEELVLYIVKKHWIDLVVPVFLTPLFLFYFWNIFLNSHSLFSWIIMTALLGFIFYPIARYKLDRMVITNKFVHIKAGVLNPNEIDIPLKNINSIELSQTSMGRMLDYGLLTYTNRDEKRDYGNIKAPEELEYIIENPIKFIEENID